MNDLNILYLVLPFVSALVVQGIVMSFVKLDTDSFEARLIGGLGFQLGALAGGLVVARMAFSGGLGLGFGLTPRRLPSDALAGMLGYLVIMPIVLVLFRLGQLLLPTETHYLLQTLPKLEGAWIWMVVVTAVVLAPLMEEVVFRGLVQSWLRHHVGAWPAILIASGAFAMMHVSLEPHAVPALFALSVALGYVYERTGRLWGSIIMHALFNGINIAIILTAM